MGYDVLHMEKWSEQVWFPLYSVWAVFLIFLLCVVPELLRQRLHKTVTVQIIEKKTGKIL